MTVCVQVCTQGGPFTDDVGDSGNVSIPLPVYVYEYHFKRYSLFIAGALAASELHIAQTWPKISK